MDKHLITRPVILLLRALLLGMALLMSTTVAAEDSAPRQPILDDLKDGDVLLAPIGRRGAGVRISIQSSVQEPAGFHRLDNGGVLQVHRVAAEVFLSVVIPW